MRGPHCVNSGIVSIPRRHFSSSCSQTAARAFWKYRCFRGSLLFDERNPAGAPQMREQLASKSRNSQQSGSRGIATAVLCASLMAGVAWMEPTAATAQATSSDPQPSAGMGTTSPLATRSTRPAASRWVRPKLRRPASVPPLLRKVHSRRAVPVPTAPDLPALRLTVVGFRQPHRSPAPTAALFRLRFPRRRRSGAPEFRWEQPKSAVPASARLHLWPAQA